MSKKKEEEKKDPKVMEVDPFELEVSGFEQKVGTVLFLKVYMSAIAQTLIKSGAMTDKDFKSVLEREMNKLNILIDKTRKELIGKKIILPDTPNITQFPGNKK